MRVLFWSELFWPHIGGAEIGGLQLISGLRKRGHTFSVVTRQDDSSESTHQEYQSTPIVRFPFWKSLAARKPEQLLKIRRDLIKFLRGFSPDLVHIHSLGPSSLFYIETAQAYECPLLVTLTSHPPEILVGVQLFKRIVESADWITAKSFSAVSRARDLVPDITPRSSVVYRGVSNDSVTSESEPPLYPTILCVGRLGKEKGFDLAIQALSCICSHFPEARMVFAGHGPERDSLEKLTGLLGLTRNIKFLGWVIPERIPALMRDATVVMIPSRRECLPRVAVEAAYLRKPVIGANVGGMAEVVIHGQTGILVEPESPSKLAEAAVELLTNRERASAMGMAALHRAIPMFDLNRCIDAYHSIYEQLTLVRSGSG